MGFRKLTATCAIAAVMATGATRVAADAGDAIAGALVGGIIGHAIAKDQQRRQQQTVVRRAPAVQSQATAAQRQANRDMQTALNYFGFGAGSVDGAVGPGTRAAVSRYQAYMSYPSNGWMQPHERDFLMAAFSWATSGGAATSGATTPQEQLIAYRRVMSGQPAQPQMPVAAPPTTVMVVTPQQATPEPPAALPQIMAAAPAPEASPALPNFMAQSTPTGSLASHCNRVSLLTSTNGGFVTEATMTDPTFALEEQFCLARTYAISEGEELAGKVQGFTPQQIAEQCAGFAPSMRPYVSAISLRPAAEVVEDVSQFLLDSGMAPAQLTGTAKICLSVGYRTDDLDVALGSALALVALGEGVYGELVGHHLAQGFGASQRPDLALAWYETSLNAVDGGARAVFAPGQPARQSLIRKAAFQLGGGQSDAAAPTPATTIPTFAVVQ